MNICTAYQNGKRLYAKRMLDRRSNEFDSYNTSSVFKASLFLVYCTVNGKVGFYVAKGGGAYYKKIVSKELAERLVYDQPNVYIVSLANVAMENSALREELLDACAYQNRTVIQ